MTESKLCPHCGSKVTLELSTPPVEQRETLTHRLKVGGLTGLIGWRLFQEAFHDDRWQQWDSPTAAAGEENSQNNQDVSGVFLTVHLSILRLDLDNCATTGLPKPPTPHLPPPPKNEEGCYLHELTGEELKMNLYNPPDSQLIHQPPEKFNIQDHVSLVTMTTPTGKQDPPLKLLRYIYCTTSSSCCVCSSSLGKLQQRFPPAAGNGEAPPEVPSSPLSGGGRGGGGSHSW